MAASDPPVLPVAAEATKTPDPEPTLESAAAANGSKKYASRDDFLSAAGKLAEEEITIEGIGTLLCSELTGATRAEILNSAIGMDASGQLIPVIDISRNQRAILLAGVVDPESPVGARRPFFRAGDMDSVMKVGGGKIEQVVGVIERLSAMGRHAGGAEGNSGGSPSGDSTSG